MTRRRLLISGLLWGLAFQFCTGSVLAQTGKTLVVRPASGAFAGKTFYTNSHALVIGISHYGFLPKEKWLDYAAKDASDLRDLLIRSYGFLPENITVLLNEQATKASIEAALATLTDDNRVKREDRVLVFFSGHGQTVKLTNGGDMGFLIPYDAKVDLAHPENRGPYLASCLPMDHVWSYLQASPAKHSLLLADACYGGLLTKSRSLSSEKPNAAVVAGLLTRPAMQVLTAGSRDEEAFEDPKLGHGAFTYKLLEELRAQAAVADNVFLVSELAAALKVSVGNATNGKQTPQFGNYDNTEGDFVFVSTAMRDVPPLVSLHGNDGVTQGVKTKINPKDGAVMVFIPAGEFLMGDDDQADNPRHSATLSGYWIYKDLVTVGMYKKFCEANGKQMPDAPNFNRNWSKEDHPMVNVTWDDAVAYCRWAGVALPTEAQWEKAARGVDGRKYAWGNTFDSSKLWSQGGGTHRVGELGISPYGCTDMAGNAWQWCADLYDANKTTRNVRGGSWSGGEEVIFRASYRSSGHPGEADVDTGFRCVLTP